ncbi:MAG: hypothetical protein JWQ02_3896, partial [Capsulimonas sp.]|nr:hypothetical protein [Capsulimonas sp.]
LHGRVYEYQSDLSPDGTKLIYLARQDDRRHSADKKVGAYYGVVCKPPYFTALAAWSAWKSVTPGYFLSNTQVSCSSFPFQEAPSFKPGKGKFPDDWQFIGVQHPTYQPAQTRLSERYRWRRSNDVFEIHEKEIIQTPSYLQRKQLGTKFVYSVRTGSQIASIARADWADIDQRGRFVFTRDGKLFVCKEMTGGLDGAVELADFNASKFEPIEAPEWAKEW